MKMKKIKVSKTILMYYITQAVIQLLHAFKQVNSFHQYKLNFLKAIFYSNIFRQFL